MSDADSSRQRVGTTLKGKWTLERLIGVGGMAAVYAATHKIGRREAIKILHPEVAGSREIVERFEQEAHAVNRFRHPGAVEVRDVDVADDGAPFLVMELLEGESLGQRVLREAVPLGEALRFGDELLDVLAAAHAEGIIHRDVKPDNLFVTREGRLKVLDFGIARMLEGSPRQQRTAAGLSMGTPQYMPPEQVLGGKVDARADLYAVGATLFRLVAGRHVHTALADMELLVKVATEPAPPLCSVAPHAPAALGLVVDRALALHPDDRYPDARTMQTDVRALRQGASPPFASAHPPARAAASARSAPTSAGVAAAPAPFAHEPTGIAPTRAPVPLGYTPTGVAPAPASAHAGYAPTGIATAQAPPGYAPTGIAPSRLPTGVAHASTHAGYAPTGVAPASAAPTGPPTGIATSPTQASPGPAFAVISPAAEGASAWGGAASRGQGGAEQRTRYLVVFGALALAFALLLGVALWLWGGDSATATPDPPLPGPVATGDEAAPPGAGGGAPGARPPAVGAPPTTPPRSGPAPVVKPPSVTKDRERELEKEREKQRELEKEREKQRERDKKGKKK